MPIDPPEIRLLGEEVANQIAAGEVIERPAAVVKELSENSLDAGATRITVRCEDGGRRLVEVEDDGHGMRPDDLRLALGRHATSKLRGPEDLFRIATLGFRGEALPSIAAVSELELASRPHDSDRGWRLVVNGGQEQAFAACAMAPGTRVAVRNLFWNVPVRLKFLKSEASETGHVTEQVIRLALAHPRVAFRLEVGGRALVDQPADETLDARVRTLFGRDLAAALLPTTANAEGMQLVGFVAHPGQARPSAKRQYVFLNGRWLRDRLLLAAVREGFKGFLEPRLHGAVFLHLDIDPALVDVNVHPTKSEVRFRREGEVFALVSRAIRAVLGENAGGFSLLPSAPVRHEVVRPAPAVDGVQQRFLAPAPDILSNVRSAKSGVDAAAMPVPAAARLAEPAAVYAAAAAPAPRMDGGQRMKDDLPRIHRILQLNRMYLLIETDDGIRLVDQHALHEKALWLCLDRDADGWGDGTQALVVPLTVELSAAEVAALEPVLPTLAQHGIEAEPFGPTTLVVRRHPARLKRVDWQAFFAGIAADGADAAVDRLRERIAHRAACHGAVKAGQELSSEEQLELVRLLYRFDTMEHCPHGRPTTLDLSWAELARRFQR